MLAKLRIGLEDVFVVALVLSVSVGHNPGCSAGALFALLAYRIADRYFKATVFDENKALIAELRVNFAKLKAKQDQQDLKTAFGGKNA